MANLTVGPKTKPGATGGSSSAAGSRKLKKFRVCNKVLRPLPPAAPAAAARQAAAGNGQVTKAKKATKVKKEYCEGYVGQPPGGSRPYRTTYEHHPRCSQLLRQAARKAARHAAKAAGGGSGAGGAAAKKGGAKAAARVSTGTLAERAAGALGKPSLGAGHLARGGGGDDDDGGSDLRGRRRVRGRRRRPRPRPRPRPRQFVAGATSAVTSAFSARARPSPPLGPADTCTAGATYTDPWTCGCVVVGVVAAASDCRERRNHV